MAKKQDEATSLTEQWAVWIIGLCVVLLLFGIGCYVVNKTILKPKAILLEIKIVTDTLHDDETYSKVELDSLISITKTTLEAYEHCFQVETEKKENEDGNKSLVALLLSIIVGVGGFFGFKSFKDIKDKGNQTAKEVASSKAKEIAEIIAKKAAEKYLASKLPEVVQKQFEESFEETTIVSIKESIKADIVPQILQAMQSSEEEKEEMNPKDVHNKVQASLPMSPDEMFN